MDIILESLKLSKTEKSMTAEKTMAMLYTLADKFLEGKDLEEVIKNIIEEFSLSDEEAEKYMKMYW